MATVGVKGSSRCHTYDAITVVISSVKLALGFYVVFSIVLTFLSFHNVRLSVHPSVCPRLSSIVCIQNTS